MPRYSNSDIGRGGGVSNEAVELEEVLCLVQASQADNQDTMADLLSNYLLLRPGLGATHCGSEKAYSGVGGIGTTLSTKSVWYGGGKGM